MCVQHYVWWRTCKGRPRRRAREAFAGGADCFGEEHLLLKLRDFLGKQGWEVDKAVLLTDDLRCCDCSLPPDALDLPLGWARQPPENDAAEKNERTRSRC